MPSDLERISGWEQHREEQRLAWLRLSYAGRLRWLESAKRFAKAALEAREVAPRPHEAVLQRVLGEPAVHRLPVVPVRRRCAQGAYLQPWAGATSWIPVGGTATLGSHTFKDPYVIPIAAAHVGYEF